MNIKQHSAAKAPEQDVNEYYIGQFSLRREVGNASPHHGRFASIPCSGSEHTTLILKFGKMQLHLDPAYFGNQVLMVMLLRSGVRGTAKDTTIMSDDNQRHPPLGLGCCNFRRINVVRPWS